MRDYLLALVLLASITPSNGATLWSWSHENTSQDIHDVLEYGFGHANTKGKFGIGSDDSLTLAPSPSGDGTYVLRVFYKEEGGFAPRLSWIYIDCAVNKIQTNPYVATRLLLNSFAANVVYVISNANSLDPDETPRNSTSHQDPNCTFASYNSSGLKCVKGVPCQRGAQFYAEPTSLAAQNYTTLTLEYEVWFDQTFQWSRGGKLPGLWGGSRNCSGSRIGDTCFSTRMMWRSDGDGEVYAYVTHSQQPSWDQFCEDNDDLSSCEKYRQIHCTSSTGIQIGKGAFQFTTNQWVKIRQEVYLNSLPDEPGYVKLWVNDLEEIYVNNITMRINNDFDIDGMFFSTFYGGSDSSWACPNDTYTYYRNFRISDDTHLYSPPTC